MSKTFSDKSGYNQSLVETVDEPIVIDEPLSNDIWEEIRVHTVPDSIEPSNDLVIEWAFGHTVLSSNTIKHMGINSQMTGSYLTKNHCVFHPTLIQEDLTSYTTLWNMMNDIKIHEVAPLFVQISSELNLIHSRGFSHNDV